MSELTVVSAALRNADTGEVYSLPPPARHNHLLHGWWSDRRPPNTQITSYCRPPEQGFLLSDGSFATRKEAARVAINAGQILELKWPPLLYTEDLW